LIVWFDGTTIDLESRAEELTTMFSYPRFELVSGVHIVFYVIAVIAETDSSAGDSTQFYIIPFFFEHLSHRFLHLSMSICTASV
jgi:hypothetical protein